MSGGWKHPPKQKTSLYSEKQLQNTIQSIQSKIFFMKQSCNCYRGVTTDLLNIIAKSIKGS